jgi:hypothetical protein
VKPEKQNLIHDLLDQDSTREVTLAAGNRILRQRRHWRTARPIGLATLLVASTVFYLTRTLNHPSVNRVSQTAQPTSAPQVQALTDDQLLALFPNTPVGIASLSNGKKRLIFPRPGDEQRFVKRL